MEKIKFWPLTVGLELSSNCNLKCKHCYAGSKPTNVSEYSLGEVKAIIDELSDLGTMLIAFSGGEPLIYPHIYEVITYAKRKEIEVFLNTNGTVVTKEIAEKLKSGGLRHIEVSVEGMENVSDAIRGKGNFKRALRGFDACKEAGLLTGIMTTVFKSNMHQIEELIDFFYRRGAVGIGFIRFKPVGRGSLMREEELTPAERKDVIDRIFKKRIELGEEFHLKVETPASIVCALEYPEIMDSHKFVMSMQRGCPGGITSMFIRVNKTVSSCPQMPLTAGDMTKQSLSEIWHSSELFEKLRTRDFQGKCGSCKYKNICGGCRTCAQIHTGNCLGEDPGCWL